MAELSLDKLLGVQIGDCPATCELYLLRQTADNIRGTVLSYCMSCEKIKECDYVERMIDNALPRYSSMDDE
jgi:hypothetical protein